MKDSISGFGNLSVFQSMTNKMFQPVPFSDLASNTHTFHKVNE